MTHLAYMLAGVSNSGKRISTAARNSEKLSLILLSSFLVIATVIATVSGVAASRKNSDDNSHSASLAILRSSCSSTRYPDLCFSSIAAVPSIASSLASLKDVIESSLNLTITAVERTYSTIEKLLGRRGLNRWEKTALHDCLEDVDLTLDELHKTEEDLKMYPRKKSLSQHADNATTKYSFANAVIASGKISFASGKDFPTHFSVSAARRQLCVAKSIADAILTASANPYTITNALQRRPMRRKRDVRRHKSNFSNSKTKFADDGSALRVPNNG